MGFRGGNGGVDFSPTSNVQQCVIWEGIKVGLGVNMMDILYSFAKRQREREGGRE